MCVRNTLTVVVIEVKINNTLAIAAKHTHLSTARVRVPRTRLTFIWRFRNLEGVAIRRIWQVFERLCIAELRSRTTAILGHLVNWIVYPRVNAEHGTGRCLKHAKQIADRATCAHCGARLGELGFARGGVIRPRQNWLPVERQRTWTGIHEGRPLLTAPVKSAPARRPPLRRRRRLGHAAQ
jgi:hypothetical protein